MENFQEASHKKQVKQPPLPQKKKKVVKQPRLESIKRKP